jgi:protein-disulfide isomerase
MKTSSAALAVLTGAALAAFMGCSLKATQAPRSLSPDDVVATVGSTSITLSQVDEKALQQPASSFGNVKLVQALYDARRAALDEVVDDLLITQDATARGIPRATLVAQEITSKVLPVSDADVQAWYLANQGRVQGASLEQVNAPIRALLLQQRTADARQKYVDHLRSTATIRILLDSPRQEVATANRPSRGPATAPIEFIEFSDFECPFCLAAHSTVEHVMQTYGDKIHFTYRHFPLPNHPHSRQSAEASACAAEQNKFWPYHDLLFADAGHLADADLKSRAAGLKLDTKQFDACVDSRKYKADVDADIRAGTEAGVDGTPAFFINGRMLTGAQPYELFKRVIDEELQRKQKT